MAIWEKMLAMFLEKDTIFGLLKLDLKTKICETKPKFPETYTNGSRAQIKINSEAPKFEPMCFDEYKTLPQNISPKSSPIKTKNRPEEISGYRNISMEQFFPKNPFKTKEIELKNVCENNVPSSDLPKSITNEWTEINLDSSSPDEFVVDNKQDIPYQRFDTSPHETNGIPPISQTPKKRILCKQLTLPSTAETKSLKSKMKLDSNLSSWISRSSAKTDEEVVAGYNSGRRQSLDNILGPTSEKVKEIFSHGIMMLNISSLTERRNSEPRCTDSPPNAAEGGKPNVAKKIPSPLEKTLTYLTSNNDDDTTGSDTDSLASCDMLTEEQIQSLMLDRDIDIVCEQLLGTPISEVCPKLIGSNSTAAPTDASVHEVASKTNQISSQAAVSSHK